MGALDTHAPFIFCLDPLLKNFIFPPKNLEKIRAPKIRMRQLF